MFSSKYTFNRIRQILTMGGLKILTFMKSLFIFFVHFSSEKKKILKCVLRVLKVVLRVFEGCCKVFEGYLEK